MSALLSRVLRDLRITPERTFDVPQSERAVPLPSRLATGELAWASVAAVQVAIGAEVVPALDPDRIALAYRSDRFLRIDGEHPDVWSPHSGFWRASDGWIRTHGNYPHHARALLDGLGLDAAAAADDIRAAVAAASARDSVERITRAGGLAVVVSPEDPARDAALCSRPLIELARAGDASPESSRELDSNAPLRGIRVLDLTRVIAGPVCTRTLALLGADVLRIDPPALPEPEWQHLDTGHGKRTAVLDARSAEMNALLGQADVVVLGYRPAALARLGLSPDVLTERHPGLVVAQLSAWGAEHPDRAGFDSLVQAESGIAMVESPDGQAPGVLPAQALDHSAGYLLAAAVCAALNRRRAEGGSWQISTSLRRVAAELLRMPRDSEPSPQHEIDPAGHTQDFSVDGHTVTTVRPVLPWFSFAAPHPWAADAPGW
ncbi:CoA transferase [Microbacterium sp. KHB019]|uniref:CoA transferase n=1 Tax=Microbacterium sp. KHB019 TaxID=3129770 RepID=UPI003078AF1E